MAKNIIINIDNSLTGEVELFASAPMANGSHQTAPPFSQKAQYRNGTIILTDVQETPDDQSWYYTLFVRPAEQGHCSTAGNMQYRFYVPSSESGVVTYEWLGTPDNSISIKKEDGVEVARNLSVDPRCVSTVNYRAAGLLTAGSEDGIPYIKVREDVPDSTLYVDPSKDLKISEHLFKVGDILTISTEVRTTIDRTMQGWIATYNGASVEYLDRPYVSVAPTDGWVRVSATARITNLGTNGYFRMIMQATPANAPVGDGFDIRRYMVIANGQTVEYFDGDSIDVAGPYLSSLVTEHSAW